MKKEELKDADVVAITGATARTKLQDASQRRAIIDYLVEAGGRASIGEINERFGFDCRAVVRALTACGWLDLISRK